MSREWFSNWFDTPYYHILYGDRDYTEAQLFIDKLISKLNPKKENKILDLACGKGRHAVYLNKKGFSVEGCDLSAQSISHAKKFENDTLHFYEHDMRNKLNRNYDYVFNLFTSFGYFQKTDENSKVLQSVHNALPQNGIFVLDFMNATKVINNLVPSETKTINGITFNINRKHENGFITKEINFVDKGDNFQFEEKVQAIGFNSFETMFNKVGMNIVGVYGNYNLDSFDSKESDRLILITKKEGEL